MRLDLGRLTRGRKAPPPKKEPPLRFRLLTLHAEWGWHARVYADGRLIAKVTSTPSIKIEVVSPPHRTAVRLAALPEEARDAILRQVVESDITF
jgi:hypothetical protein